MHFRILKPLEQSPNVLFLQMLSKSDQWGLRWWCWSLKCSQPIIPISLIVGIQTYRTKYIRTVRLVVQNTVSVIAASVVQTQLDALISFHPPYSLFPLFSSLLCTTYQYRQQCLNATSLLQVFQFKSANLMSHCLMDAHCPQYVDIST